MKSLDISYIHFGTTIEIKTTKPLRYPKCVISFTSSYARDLGAEKSVESYTVSPGTHTALKISTIATLNYRIVVIFVDKSMEVVVMSMLQRQ